MTDPVLHLLAGPNGAGKTTFYERVLAPATHLPFVNADVLAAQHWPDDTVAHAYDASQLAAELREQLLRTRRSFATETVFSHPSKTDLIRHATELGYLVSLHVILVPEELAVARVTNRVANGGHDVPAAKVRARYRRLWHHVRDAIALAREASVYDNSSARMPYRLVASFEGGHLVGEPAWPAWTPLELTALGS